MPRFRIRTALSRAAGGWLAVGLAGQATGGDRPGFPPLQARLDTTGLVDAWTEDPAPEEELIDFTDLDIEQLMQIEVTSVAGREQVLLDTPAAVTVLTREDLRRTGHRNIAEALRMVPGFTVGQVSPSIWAVGSRGFASRFSNDLLVLIDGRSVYDPLFSGVFWNVQDVLLEDLDRIEVIRGPGATLWGANAVNGVINITTRSAEETQGLYVTGGGGNVYEGFGAIRYGGRIDENAWFRVYFKYDNDGPMDDLAGSSSATAWDMYRGGFRFDWETDEDIEMTFQGDLYATGRSGEPVRVPVPGVFTFESDDLEERYQGGNALFRASRRHSEDQGWSLQAYYDRTETKAGRPGWQVRRDTIDLDYRSYFPLAEGTHVLMWGAGYRHSDDRTTRADTLEFRPRTRSLDTFSGFIQDTITLAPDRAALLIGSKFEHNDFTGFEWQPSARLSLTPDDRQIIWGAVSRPVRTPSRIAEDVILTTAYANAATPLTLDGDSGIDSEELMSYELGYRVQLTDDVTFDVSTFYNDYDDLITLGLPDGTLGNRGEADTYGVELAGTWQAAPNWSLSAAYTFIKIDFDSVDGNAEEGETPEQQFNVQSFLDITDDLELNTALYYVDTIPEEGADAYVRLDVGVTWRPAPNTEVAVWGQNLLDKKHFEFGDDLFLEADLEVERSIYAQLTFRF